MDMMQVRRKMILYSKKKSVLPEGYTQVEYVYCDDSQPFIILDDYEGTENRTIWVRVSRDEGYTAEGGFVGNTGNYGGGEFEIYYQNGDNKIFRAWPNGWTKLISSVYGDTYDEVTVRLFRSTNGTRLLGRFRNGSYKHHGKIFEYAEFDVDKNIIHHLYPCISPDNVVGFYCIVTNYFYGPASSAVFVAGPDV